MTELAVVMQALQSERDYQKKCFGDDSQRVPADFIVFMEDYLPRLLHVRRVRPDSTTMILRKVITLALALLEKQDLSMEQVLETVQADRAKGRDYSGLALSVYLLRIETCLSFARRAVVSTGGEKELKNWILDLINHGIACFEVYGINPRD